MEKVNVIVGRFQPLTLGHLKGAEEVWNKYGIRTVFCIVNTPESKLNEKHPFPSDLIIEQNEMLGREEYFGGFAPIINADIGKIAKVCRDIGKEPVMWTCGSDRVKAYEKQCVQKYIDMYDLDPEIRVHEIKRTDEDISASKVRECISKNDYKGYCKLMPKWSHDKHRFELYKEYIVIRENNRFEGMRSLKDYINEVMIQQTITESVFRHGGHTKDSIGSTQEMFDKIVNGMKDTDYKKWNTNILKDSAVKKACSSCDKKVTKMIISEFIDMYQECDGDFTGDGQPDDMDELIDEEGEYWFEQYIYNTLACVTDNLGNDYDMEMKAWGRSVDLDDLIIAIEQVFIKTVM